ncbi:MAG: hypothetical protein H8E16_07655 [Flavobacteriales bacterium]|nr:hypothetical protein [Flavobacteriales bacterium]
MKKILIIDNTQSDYELFFDSLENEFYDCYPKKNEYKYFIATIEAIIDDSVKKTNEESSLLKEKLDEYLLKDYDLIILDFALLHHTERNYKLVSNSCHEQRLLPKIRNIYSRVPVLLVSRFNYNEIDSIFKDKPNYFLNKEYSESHYLTDNFIDKGLKPVVSFLIEFNNFSVDALLNDLSDIKAIKETTLNMLEKVENIEIISSNILENTQLLKYETDLLIRIAQIDAKNNNKSCLQAIDNLIEEIPNLSLPEIIIEKHKIKDIISKNREELINILKTKGKEAFINLLKNKIKEIADVPDDELLSVAILKVIFKSFRKIYRFIRVGDFD